MTGIMSAAAGGGGGLGGGGGGGGGGGALTINIAVGYTSYVIGEGKVAVRVDYYGYSNAANDPNGIGFGYPASGTFLGATINALYSADVDGSGVTLILNGDQTALSIGHVLINGVTYAFGSPSFSGGQTGWGATATGGNKFGVAPNRACTLTIASPCVVTSAAHGFSNGDRVLFKTGGALPTGLTVDTIYYVVNRATNTFQLATSPGGTPIATTGSQSGTHSVYGVADAVIS